jgi:hypothetical protein
MNRTGARVPSKHSNIAGSVFGLNIQYYIGFHSNLTQFMSAYGKGGYVRIENSSFLEDENLDNGVNVSPASLMYILVDRSFEFNLPKPYSNCDLENSNRDPTEKFKSNLLDVIYHSSYQYTQQLCVYQCLQNEIVQKCNCTSPSYLNLFNVNNCVLDSQFSCSNFVESDFFQTDYIKVCHFMFYILKEYSYTL